MMATKFKESQVGRIPKGWDEKPLREVARVNELTIDKTFSYDEIEYIDIGAVEQGKILEINKMLASDAPSRAQRILRKNDIIISTVRPNLKHFAFIKEAKPNTIASTGFAVITSKDIDSRFLYYYLTTDKYTNYLSAIADTHTSTYPAFNPDILENSGIPFPSSNEQRAIAKILSALDDKIELNRQMNATLEKIGQALFKHWFIDFEFPNDQGKPYKSSGGKMIDSELGKIPKGWRVGKLGEIGKIQPGYAFKSSDFTTDGIKVIKIRNIQNSVIDIYGGDYVSEEVCNQTDKKFYLSSGDVLIAMTGAELGKVGVIPQIERPMLLNQRVGKVVSNHGFLFYLFLTQDDIQSYMKGISSASSAQGNISNTDIESIKVSLPNESIVNMFTDMNLPLYRRIVHNLGENLILSQIRDSLLPKLMSGEIRVKLN